MKKVEWPFADEREKIRLQEVLDSHEWWRGAGRMVKEFEQKFADFHQAKYALGVSNGTLALEIALKALGVTEGDEVIVPAFTFASTATAVLNCGASPVFCDIKADTFCMDPAAFEKCITDKTKAVIPVHMAGHLCDMEQISCIAHRNNIRIIEDAAHAQGGEWNGHKVGYYSDIAAFSFQNRKIMTCGEGGALITNNEELYQKAFLLHSVGRPEGDIVYEHIVMGTNARMSEFHAAVLICQLERLEYMNKVREENANKLNEFLQDIPGIEVQKFDGKCTLNTHYMYMFYYDMHYFHNMDRETFIDEMNKAGIETHIPYPLVFHTDFFKRGIENKKSRQYREVEDGLFPNAVHVEKEAVWIPHYVLLNDMEHMRQIKETIIKIQKAQK